MLPVLLVAVFRIEQNRKQLIAGIYKERSTRAALSAHLLKAKLDHLSDIGMAFASRPVFKQYITEKKWAAAVALMQDFPSDFQYITHQPPNNALQNETTTENTFAGRQSN